MLSKNFLFAFFLLGCFITTLAKTNEAEILQQAEETKETEQSDQTVVPIVFTPPSQFPVVLGQDPPCFGPNADPKLCKFTAQPVQVPAGGFLSGGNDIFNLRPPAGASFEPNPPAGQCYCSCRQAPLPPVPRTTGVVTTGVQTTGFVATSGFITGKPPLVVPVVPPTPVRATGRVVRTGRVSTAAVTTGVAATSGVVTVPTALSGIISNPSTPLVVTPVTPVTPVVVTAPRIRRTARTARRTGRR